jgi:hypothetical protein
VLAPNNRSATLQLSLSLDPFRHLNKAVAQQRYIEPQSGDVTVHGFFFIRQQVEQQSGEIA